VLTVKSEQREEFIFANGAGYLALVLVFVETREQLFFSQRLFALSTNIAEFHTERAL